MKPVVRAVVYFTGKVKSTRDLKHEVETGTGVLSAATRVLAEHGYTVFTKRLSFPGLPPSLAEKLLDYLEEGYIASIGYTRKVEPEVVVGLASRGLYVPVLHSGEPSTDMARVYSDVFHRASSIDPVVATRIAIAFHGEDFQTPYFPDSSSKGIPGIGLAFIYPKTLLERVKQGLTTENAFKTTYVEFESIARLVESATNIGVSIDYSLSPWMENSVAELYEYHGYSVVNPGSVYFTWILNKYIRDSLNSSRATGFNEIMLPYAEDSLLVEYGLRGLIRASSFLLHALTCVAGVDMVVVPEDREKLAGLVSDAMAVSQVKRKPMSLRAIPVSGKPGDVVDLKRFGRVPVLAY